MIQLVRSVVHVTQSLVYTPQHVQATLLDADVYKYGIKLLAKRLFHVHYTKRGIYITHAYIMSVDYRFSVPNVPQSAKDMSQCSLKGNLQDDKDCCSSYSRPANLLVHQQNKQSHTQRAYP